MRHTTHVTLLRFTLRPGQSIVEQLLFAAQKAFLSRFDYLLDLKGQQIEFGTHEAPEMPAADARSQFQTVAGRPVVSTSLGSLVFDSGAADLTLFGARATTPTLEMFTMTGTLRVGTAWSKLVIDGRTFWRGDAIVVPHSAETGAAGLLPANLFKAVYVSNSSGYLVFH